MESKIFTRVLLVLVIVLGLFFVIKLPFFNSQIVIVPQQQNKEINLIPLIKKDILLLGGLEDFVDINLMGKAKTSETSQLIRSYVLFKKDFSSKLILSGYDSDGFEICRSIRQVSGIQSDALYLDFVFDLGASMNLVHHFQISISDSLGSTTVPPTPFHFFKKP